MESLLEQAPAFAQIGRRFRLQDELNLLREVVDAVEPAAPAPCARVEPIVLIATGNFDGLPSISGLLEEQRLAAAGRFHLAIRPFRNEQIGIDRNGDALQLARLVERLDELAERKSKPSLLRREPASRASRPQ